MKNAQIISTLKKLGIFSLLESKRFWFSILSALSVVITHYQPGFEQYMPQVIEAVAFVAVAYVGGQSLKDAVIAYRDEQPKV